MQFVNLEIHRDKNIRTVQNNQKKYSKPQVKNLGSVVDITNGLVGSVVDTTGPGTMPPRR